MLWLPPAPTRRMASTTGTRVLDDPHRRLAMAMLGGVAGTTVLAGAGLGAVWAGLGTGVAGVAVLALLERLGRPVERSPAAQPAAGARAPLSGEAAGAELLNALPLGLLLLDETGRVLFVNTTGEEMIERPVTGLPGTAALRAPLLAEAITRALEENEPSEFEVTLLRSKERLIQAAVSPLRGGWGQARVLVLLEDRTRAVKAEALRRDFVANASHELRTPLASIAGFIETLQGHARNDPEAAERFLKIMATQAERMRRLIDDLLSLNRIEINEHVLPRDRVDLIAAVRETASALVPVAEANGTAVEVDLPERAVTVRASQDELAQVFANLIDNAVKYAGEGGPVRVVLEPSNPSRPGMVGITVADSGPGIAREHLPRLTERFYRVSTERSRQRGGTGLGLAIAKHILNRHRGDLAVSSTLGAGSRFTVWLPLLAEGEAPGRVA